MPPEGIPGVNPNELPTDIEVDAAFEEIREDLSPEDKIIKLLGAIEPSELADKIEQGLSKADDDDLDALAKLLDKILR